MKLTIYRPNGTAIFDIIPDTSSGHDWSLMTDNRLSISFELERCIVLLPGYYVDFDGIRYYIIEEYKPTLVNSTQWKYNVTLKDAASWLAITVALNMIDGKNTPIFQYTATAAEHAAIIVNNLNRRMGTLAWKVGSVIETGNISIDYSGKYCSDVLQEIVDGEGTEWWVDGMTLNIGRAEFGDPIVLGYRQGLLGNITCAQADNIRSYAYLFPVGSTRNIDPTKYGYDRLQLPNGQTRVDMNVEQGVAELVEEKAFSHIFPRYIGKVTSVSTSTGTSEDGTSFLIYFVEDKNIPFNPNEYELPGAVKHIIFQSGELMGVDFEVNYNAATHEFEIITQWPNGGGQLPGGLLVPKVGDEYVVWNITMPNEYYSRASQEFLEAAQAFAASAVKDVSVYKAQLDYIDVQERGLKVRPGQRVRLLSNEFFSSGYYDSRITRITRKLDIPDAVNIDVSAIRVVGTIQKLQNSLQSTASQVAQVTNTVQTVVQTVTNAVTLTGNQRVKGVKNFVDGIKVCDSPILSYDPKTKSWLFDGNLIVTGAGAFHAELGDLDVPTIMDALVTDEQSISKAGDTLKVLWQNLPIDGNTIKRNADGTLSAPGGGSGGGSAEVTYDSVISALGYTPLASTEEVLEDLNDATAGRFFTMTSGYGSTNGNKPTEYWATGLTLAYAQNSSFRRQLAFAGGHDDSLYIRAQHNGTWKPWSKVLTSSLDGKYLAIGANIGQANVARAQLDVISADANPSDITMGADSQRYWDLTARNANGGVGKAFGIYNYTASSYALFVTETNNVAIGGDVTPTERLRVTATSGWSTSFKNTNAAVSTSHADGYGMFIASTMPTTSSGYLFRVWQGSLSGVSGTGTAIFDVMANREFHIRHIGVGSYSEGLRLYNSNGAKDGWSEINFGCDPSATSGTHDYQWTIGRNSSNNFIIRNAWTDRFQIDLSGYASLWGNLIVTGGITAHYTSDERLKTNLRPINAGQMILSLGRVREFEYIDSEIERNSLYKGSHIGLIYQDVKGSALSKMCFEREDGYGSLNYFDTSLKALLVGVAQEHEIRLTEDERELQAVKEDNKALRKEIEYLKQRVA